MEKGVFIANKKDGSIYYRSSVTYKNKHISLGSFDSEIPAANAYQDAVKILESEDLTIEKCINLDFSLSFEKIVSLINYRDNGLYSPNPLYISGKILYYYYSENEIYKFDIDDLFYYAKHKIQKRGGHLFVADCGKQINIASRYGIKNNAVLNKDYRFINNDITDYRYSNIEIFNSYQGVEVYHGEVPGIKRKSSKIRYRAFIHINGNYNIGIYDSMEKAAIAYNKAADILNQNGLNKNFTRNVINKMTAKKYNSLYNSTQISEEIVKLKF